MIKLSKLNTITYKNLEWMEFFDDMPKIDKAIYSLAIKIRCKIYGHDYDYKKMKNSLCHGCLDDRCERCGKYFWKIEDFDFWGGVEKFFEMNKGCLSEEYWGRLRERFPELEEYGNARSND